MSASVTTQAKVEELKQDTEIQKALDQTSALEKAVSLPRKRQHKFFLTTYLLVLFLFGAAYYLIHLSIIHIAEPYFPFLQRFFLGLIAIVASPLQRSSTFI